MRTHEVLLDFCKLFLKDWFGAVWNVASSYPRPSFIAVGRPVWRAWFFFQQLSSGRFMTSSHPSQSLPKQSPVGRDCEADKRPGILLVWLHLLIPCRTLLPQAGQTLGSFLTLLMIVNLWDFGGGRKRWCCLPSSPRLPARWDGHSLYEICSSVLYVIHQPAAFQQKTPLPPRARALSRLAF